MLPPVQEKDKEKKEKEKEGKEKDKKTINGHLFTSVSSGQGTQCSQCNKAFNSKEAYHCARKYLYHPICILFFFIPLFVISFFVTTEDSCCFKSNQSKLSPVIHN